MTIQIPFARGLCSTLAIVALAGCATSGQRSRVVHKAEASSFTNMIAYRAGTNLLLRFPVLGKDVYVHADWTEPPEAGAGYHHQFAVVTLEDEERATKWALMKRTNRIAVRDSKQWQKLAQNIFAGMLPDQPGHGTVVMLHHKELVILRDASGKPGVVTLEKKPAEITVDQTFNEGDFSRRAISLLEAGIGTMDGRRTQFLFVTGEDPAFVLVDLRERLMVFLSYPADPENRPMGDTGWFAVRALNSLFIRSFVITAIKNPVTLITRGFWHIGSSGAAMFQSGTGSSSEPPPPLYTGPPMDLAEWETRLDHLTSARRYKGRVDLLIDGEKFFSSLIESISDATRGVDMQIFIFDNDDYALKIADLLKSRSKAVRVRVLIDELGSLFAGQSPPQTPPPPDYQAPKSIDSYLRSGSRVHLRAAANPWLTVDHRKCIVIDGRLAYVGGMNIGREYRSEWHDMMVGLTGPVVGRLEKDFREAWAHAGPLGDFAYVWVWAFGRKNPQKLEVANAIDIRPLRTATGRVDIYRAQLEAIQRARRRIYIENAYFDDDTIVRALIQARRRGVDVRVIFPGVNDSEVMQTGNLVLANDMIRNGIRIYAYPKMTHIKAAIYDGWACLGSANFDKMSLRVSQELDVAYSDPESVERLERELFEADFSSSRELKEPAPLEWLDSVVKAMADQL